MTTINSRLARAKSDPWTGKRYVVPRKCCPSVRSPMVNAAVRRLRRRAANRRARRKAVRK